MQLRFTDEANNDIKYIRWFLHEAGVTDVKSTINAIVTATENLQVFPKMGVLVSSSSKQGEIRDYYYKDYCLCHLVTNNCIYILRVWHQKENERSTPS